MTMGLPTPALMMATMMGMPLPPGLAGPSGPKVKASGDFTTFSGPVAVAGGGGSVRLELRAKTAVPGGQGNWEVSTNPPGKVTLTVAPPASGRSSSGGVLGASASAFGGCAVCAPTNSSGAGTAAGSTLRPWVCGDMAAAARVARALAVWRSRRLYHRRAAAVALQRWFTGGAAPKPPSSLAMPLSPTGPLASLSAGTPTTPSFAASLFPTLAAASAAAAFSPAARISTRGEGGAVAGRWRRAAAQTTAACWWRARRALEQRRGRRELSQLLLAPYEEDEEEEDEAAGGVRAEYESEEEDPFEEVLDAMLLTLEAGPAPARPAAERGTFAKARAKASLSRAVGKGAALALDARQPQLRVEDALLCSGRVRRAGVGPIGGVKRAAALVRGALATLQRRVGASKPPSPAPANVSKAGAKAATAKAAKANGAAAGGLGATTTTVDAWAVRAGGGPAACRSGGSDVERGDLVLDGHALNTAAAKALARALKEGGDAEFDRMEKELKKVL
jgi:hypothetical protein